VRLSITAQGDREIVMRRVFAAPRRLLFDAWTRPELFVRWFGREGWTTSVTEMDVRPGGAYRYLLRGPDGTEVVMRGQYLEVVPPERLVTTEYFEGFTEPGWRPEDATVSTATFAEQDGGTLWTSKLRYPTQQIRDAALALEPAWTGVEESYARLEELLATVGEGAA
jgi:uncharacterized protein YndB with AHSA1/START domain